MDYEKYAAQAAHGAQLAAMQNATGGIVGGLGQAVAPPEPPLFMRLVQGSEAAAQMAAAIEDRLSAILARAVGPMPADQNTTPTPQSVPGHLGALDLRLTSTLRTLERIGRVVERLERII